MFVDDVFEAVVQVLVVVCLPLCLSLDCVERELKDENREFHINSFVTFDCPGTNSTGAAYYSKPVFKGHSVEGTPCDLGKLSQISGPHDTHVKEPVTKGTCDVGTLSLGYRGVP